MKERTTKTLLRSVALVGAMAAGATAFGDRLWTGGADTTVENWRSLDGVWSVESNWQGSEGNYAIEWQSSGRTISFTEMSTIDVDLWIQNADDPITFSSDSLSSGLVQTAGDVYLGALNRGRLVINGGSYTFNRDMYLAYERLWWEPADTDPQGVGELTVEAGELSVPGSIVMGNVVGAVTSLTLNGGKVTAGGISLGDGTGTVTLNGGTLSTTEVGEGLSLVVGSKGGTFDNAADADVRATVTGSGTLTKTGAGNLSLGLADLTGFTGKIAVANGAGTVSAPVQVKTGSYTKVVEDEGVFFYSYDPDWTVPTVAKWGTALTLGLETTSRPGWTLTGNGQDWATLARPDKESGNYLAYYAYGNGNVRGSLVSYSIPSDTSAILAGEAAYKIDMDWFATVGYNGRESDDLHCFLTWYAGDAILFSINAAAVYNGGKNGVDAVVYGYGGENTGVTVHTAPRGSDSNDASKSDYWYHVSLTAKADGAYLTVSKTDGTVVVDNRFVGDYVLPTKIEAQVRSRLQSDGVIGGIDDIVISVPAEAAVDDVGYVTFSDAVAALAAGQTLRLWDNVELTESVTLPWGATLDLNGYSLTTRTEDVTVAFDDGVHYIASTTEGGVTTFTGIIAVYGGTCIWTGAGETSNWSDTGNWQDGLVPASSTANVYIPAPETEEEPLVITCAGSGDFTGYLTIERDVTLTGNGITLSTVKGVGSELLKLDGGQGTFYVYSGNEFKVDCDLYVENNVTLNAGAALTLNGKFLGEGSVSTASPSSSSVGGIAFNGDTSLFEGSYAGNRRASDSRDGTRFYGYAFGSASASWTLGFLGNSNYRSPFQGTDGATYEFGQLSTTTLTFLKQVRSYGDLYLNNVTIKIGGKPDSTSTVSGSLSNDSNKIVKLGDTSTLNLTLTDAKGAVEAEAGTLNLKSGSAPSGMTITGVDAVVTVADGVGTTVTTEDDPETTDVDESSSTFTPFTPALSDALAETYVLGATVGEGVITYAVRDVAEVGGVGFRTIDEAKEALTGENDTITLLCSTPSKLTVVAGDTVKIEKGEFTYGGIESGDANVTVTTEGTLETVVAVEGVAAVNGTWYTSFDEAYAACLSVNNPTLTVKVGADFVPTGMTASKGLYKIEFIATTEDPITIALTDGTYAIQPYRIVFPANATLSAVTYGATIIQGGTLNIPEGVTLQYYTGTFDVAALTGSGTLKVASVTNMGNTLPAAVQNLLKDSAWEGTLEIASSTITTAWDPSNFSNAGSSLRFNGVTTYLNTVTTTLKGVEVVGDGLTVNGQYQSGKFTFSGALSGEGAITAGVANSSNGTALKILKFVGDLSGFAGSVAFADDSNVCVQFGADSGFTDGDLAAYRVAVCEGATMTVASGKTWSANDFIVHGDLTLNGALVDRDGEEGAAGVVWNNYPSAVLRVSDPSYCALGNKTSWRGTYVIAWNPGSSNTHLVLNNYGNENSKVEIAGVNGDFIALPSTGSTAPMILPEVVLTANWTINNGWSNATTTFTKLSGAGKLTVNGSGSTGAAIPYTINTLNGFTGELAGNRGQFTIGNIVTDNDVEGACLVKLTVGLYDPVLDAAMVNGEAAELEVKTVGGVQGIYRKSSGSEPSGDDIEVDVDGCNFTVDAETAAAITEATGVAPTESNFAKAAVAYVVGGELVDDEVVIPTPTIVVNGTTVTVVYDSDTANVCSYAVTCTLWSFSLENANDPTQWTPVATGEVGDALIDSEASDSSKFYKVTVTVEDAASQVGN